MQLPDSKGEKSPQAGRGPQRRGQQTRRKILGAALCVIARRGVGATTFRDVAAEAGVSLGVVTYHFPNRRDLLAGAYALHLERTDEAGLALADRAVPAETLGADRGVDGGVDAVLSLLRGLIEDDRDSFVAGLELTLELTRDAGLASGVRDAMSSHRRLVEEMVARAGSVEPELDAEILSAAFEGLALKWLANPGDPSFEQRLRRVVARLMAFVSKGGETA